MANMEADSFDVSLIDASPDSFERNGQRNNPERERRRKNEYMTANNEDEIVLATNVITEKPVSPSTVHVVHAVEEEGTWQHPIADIHTLNINSSDGEDRDVATDEKNPDSFEPSVDIHLSNGASPIGEDWEESPRPDQQPDPDISNTNDHQKGSKLEKAEQWLSYSGSYIRNFIKIVLLLIVVYIIFSAIGNVILDLISEKLETPGVKEVQYPQPQISHLVTEFLIHHIQFDIAVLRFIFTVLLTIGKLALYINLMISEIINSLSIESYTGEFDLFMRIIAISVLTFVGIITYFMHAIFVNMAYLIDNLPFMELMNQ